MNLNAANVSKLIHYMQGLDGKNFTMAAFRICGAPACALGNAEELFEKPLEEAYLNFSDRIFGEDAYNNLFNGSRHRHIHTPQQWAAHARRVLAKAGLEVVTNAAPEVPESARTGDTPSADGTSGRSLAPPQVAAPGFAAFMERLTGPMNEERSGLTPAHIVEMRGK